MHAKFVSYAGASTAAVNVACDQTTAVSIVCDPTTAVRIVYVLGPVIYTLF